MAMPTCTASQAEAFTSILQAVTHLSTSLGETSLPCSSMADECRNPSNGY